MYFCRLQIYVDKFLQRLAPDLAMDRFGMELAAAEQCMSNGKLPVAMRADLNGAWPRERSRPASVAAHGEGTAEEGALADSHATHDLVEGQQSYHPIRFGLCMRDHAHFSAANAAPRAEIFDMEGVTSSVLARAQLPHCED